MIREWPPAAMMRRKGGGPLLHHLTIRMQIKNSNFLSMLYFADLTILIATNCSSIELIASEVQSA